jgi:hypothetical protein
MTRIDANRNAALAAYSAVAHLGYYSHLWLTRPEAAPDTTQCALIELWPHESVAVGAFSPIGTVATVLWESLAKRGAFNCTSETDLAAFRQIAESKTRQDHSALRLGHVIATYAFTHDLPRHIAATVQTEAYGVYGLPLRPLYDAVFTPLRQLLLRELHQSMDANELSNAVILNPPNLGGLAPLTLLAPAGAQADHLLAVYDFANARMPSHATAH